MMYAAGNMTGTYAASSMAGTYAVSNMAIIFLFFSANIQLFLNG